MSIKNITPYLAIALCLNITASCSESTSNTEVGIETENIPVPTVSFKPFAKDQNLTDLFSKIKFLQLEMTDDCIIGKIKKIEDADGLLVVLTNDDEIFTFDKETGKFIQQIGNKGEGPDEYLLATDIYYNEKNKSLQGTIVTSVVELGSTNGDGTN